MMSEVAIINPNVHSSLTRKLLFFLTQTYFIPHAHNHLKDIDKSALLMFF